MNKKEDEYLSEDTRGKEIWATDQVLAILIRGYLGYDVKMAKTVRQFIRQVQQ